MAATHGHVSRMAILDPNDYTVVWIAPLEIEAKVALFLLDEKHQGRFPVSQGDEYVFHAGAMCGYNVAIGTFSAGQEYGNASAAALASQAKKIFPNLQFGLLVGVAAGLPNLARSPPRDIRLGDVLVGLPDGQSSGLIAYDLGKETEDDFQPLQSGRVLTATEPLIRAAIGSIKIHAPRDTDIFLPYYETIRENEHGDGTFADPGQDLDKLYLDCADGTEEMVARANRPKTQRTRVWYGPIGSGDKLLKNARKRDELRDRYDLIGLEMEAAGTMNRIPVGVVRGVCDYGDRHKNKKWQPYAAAMAAAYAKAILAQIPPATKTVGANFSSKKACHHIQLSKNNRFIGREGPLKALQEKFFSREPCQRVALVGLGGIGKTQIALHFTYRIKEQRPDYSIFWIPILSEASIEQAYVAIARKLGLKKSKDQDDIKEVVCEYLSSDEAGKWLLVIDNADDQALVFGSENKSGIENYIPESEEGLILLTTRSRAVAVDFAQNDVIDIEQMGREEATAFLKKSLIQESISQNEMGITELLERLTYLPLAIAQAAAYLNRTTLPLHKYLDLLRGAETDVAQLLGKEFRDNTRYRNMQNAVGTTWLVSFHQIAEADQSAIDLLSFISCIEPKAIPQSILLQPDSGELEDAIATLCGYSFLVRRDESDVFDMHSLVHMATRAWLVKQQWEEKVIRNAIKHLADIFPSSSLVNRALWREYVPHGLRLLHESGQYNSDARASLSMHVGHCLTTDRRYKESLKCYEYSVQWRSTHLSEEHPDRLAAEHSLGGASISCGQIKNAIRIIEHVVEVEKATLDEKDPSRLASQHELAHAYLEDGQMKKAIQLFEHVVALRETTLAEGDHNRLLSQHVLACAYLGDGQIEKAIQLLEHVVALEETTLDEKDPSRLASQHELARAYLDDGQIKKAIQLFEHVVALREITLTEEDHDRLVSQHALACAYLDDGQIEKAIQLLEHVVALREITLTKEDHDRLASQHELACAYLNDGQIEKAIQLLEHVVALREITVTEEDHDRLVSQHALACAYFNNGQIEKAIQLLEHVVAVREITLTEEDHDRLASQHVLARAYLNDGQIEKAIQLLEHVVAVREITLTEEDHDRLVSQHVLACAYLKDRQIQKAIEILEHVVRV